MSAAAAEAADAMAHSGNTIILTPARTSWDQFMSYAQHGDLSAACA